jgi:hypothetical protein
MDRYRINLSLDKTTLELLHVAAWDAHMQPTAYVTALLKQSLYDQCKTALLGKVKP